MPPREYLMARMCQSGRVVRYVRGWRVFCGPIRHGPPLGQLSLMTMVPGILSIGMSAALGRGGVRRAGRYPDAMMVPRATSYESAGVRATMVYLARSAPGPSLDQVLDPLSRGAVVTWADPSGRVPPRACLARGECRPIGRRPAATWSASPVPGKTSSDLSLPSVHGVRVYYRLFDLREVRS